VTYTVVKVFKTQRALKKHCLLTGCKNDAMVTARRKRTNGMDMDIHLCLECATVRGLLPF
jgi:hypothetical protein